MSAPLLLPYLAPWDWQQFQQHFALRLLPGVEHLEVDRYSRSLRLGGVEGWFSVRPLTEQPALELTCSERLQPYRRPLVEKVRKMFDLDADPRAIAEHFAADPLLGPRVAANPGLRLPAAFDPFEQAVRAIVGQQVTVKAAVTITRRLKGAAAIAHMISPTTGNSRMTRLQTTLRPVSIDWRQTWRMASTSASRSRTASSVFQLSIATSECALVRAVAARPHQPPEDQAKHRQDDDQKHPHHLLAAAGVATDHADDRPDIQREDDQAK